MESPQRGASDHKTGLFPINFQMIRPGGFMFPNKRLVILCLGLLNAVLLIAAVAVGIQCAKVKEASLHTSHSYATQLLSELNNLRSNYSDALKAGEEAKSAFDGALRHHAQLKVKIQEQKAINDNYQRQIVKLQTERTKLQTNVTALEGTCGRCLPRWIHYNSSCYLFSYVESSSQKRNWPDSRADCISHGGDLVVIDNKEEQKFVSDNIEKLIGRSSWNNGFWIGLTDHKLEDSWVWINNVTENEPRYWVAGEPNDAGNTGEDCALTVSSSSNPWHTRYDGECSAMSLYYICETISR